MSQWDFGVPPAGHHDEQGEHSEYGQHGQHGQHGEYGQYGQYGPYDPYARYDQYGESDEFDDPGYSPISYERDPEELFEPAATRTTAFEPWLDESWPPRRERRERPRWLIPAAVATVAGCAAAAVVLLTGGHSAGPAATSSMAPPRPVTPAPSVPPPSAPAGAGQGALTTEQARQVVAGYTTVNNQANAQRSDTLLAGIETGSSYAIDAGIYRVQRAENAAPYPAFGPRQSAYYIPRQPPGAYPRWFVVQVANASLANPKKATGTEYLLFTQAAPGAAWKNAIEPYLVPGASAPRVALGADGLATPAGPGATSLAVDPAQLPRLTAASLDGAGLDGMAPVGNPGNLADGLDQGFWRGKLPAASVTDQHAPAPGAAVFGLRTADGGALVFYTDTAELTLAAPQGSVMHLTIPGYYSPGEALTRAGVGYLEQFAAYVPPRGGSAPKIIADYSGITARN